MGVGTSLSLVEALRGGSFLSEAQQAELTQVLQTRYPDPRALARHLLERGWLTSFQANCLLQGRGADLALGPYVLLERLGEGGNGQVFKARHRSLNRLVALKVLRKELATDAEIVGRFHREMEVLSHISHAHLVHAYDAGPIGSSLVLAMEYVDGIDLERRVQKSGPLPVVEAAEYVRQAAAGLQHAHERGLIHRDIKPANLLVANAQSPPSPGSSQQSTFSGSNTMRVKLPPWAADLGVVKILDLGLARLQQAEMKSATANLTLDYGSTVMQGTPDYMAPEQALDFHTADIRSDIYSLGCTFFFLLTGRPPFPSGSLAQKLMKHQQAEPPDIFKLRPEVPAALADVLGKMLAKKPANRFQTPGAVVDALTALFTSGALTGSAATIRVAARPTGGKIATAGFLAAPLRLPARAFRRRPRLGLAALALLLIGLPVLVILLTRPSFFFGSSETSEQRALKALLELLNQPDIGEDKLLRRVREFRHEYPGMRDPLREELLAIRMREPGTSRAFQAGIWLTYLPSPLDQLDPQQIPEKKRFANQPAELVAIAGNQGVSYTRVTALAFRPDCKMLATAGTTLQEVGIWDFGGGTPQPRPFLRGHGSYVASLAFSPDGKWLASGGGDNSAKGDNHVRLWDVTQPEIKAEAALAGHVSSVNTLAFSPDSRWLVSSGQDHNVWLWQPGQREGVVLSTKNCFVNSLAFAPDGNTLAIAGTYSNLVRLMEFTPPQPGKVVDVKNALTVHILRVAFSPEGGILAMTGGEQIVLWDTIKQEEAGRLKGHTAAVHDLVFAPDGKSLFSGELSADSQPNVNEPEGRVIRWNLATREPAGEWKFPCGGIKRLALASDGRHLAVGGRNCITYILRLAPPKVGK